MKNLQFFRSGISLMLVGLAALWAGGCSDNDGPDYPAPVLTLNEATNITRITATVTGRLDGNVESVTSCGFMYSTAESDMFVSSGSDAHFCELKPTAGTVEATFTGLEAGATYYYCLYAIAGRTTVKSEVKQFVTTESSLPMLDDVVLLAANENAIRVQSKILDAGTASQELPLIGFEYKLVNETGYVARYIKAFDPESHNTFTLTLDGLKPGSTYCIRATASNTAKGVGYSDTIQVKTATMNAPVVVTHDPAEGGIGMNWIEMSGEVENPGTSEVVEYGFCWSDRHAAPEVEDNHVETTPAEGQAFAATISGLKSNTTYYLRAYAANGTGEGKRYGYGKTVEVTTDGFRTPVFAEAVTVSDLTTSSARVGYTITDAGNGTITEKGFCYSSTTPAPTLNDQVVKVNNGGMSFTALLQDLNADTDYYVRAYAKSRIETEEAVTYSEPVILHTLNYDEPGFSALNATDITDHTARLSAELQAGTATVVEKGFCWGISTNPTIENGDSHVTVSGNVLETTLTELKNNTIYYYRAYAICRQGGNEPKTFYSDFRSFTTASMVMPVLDAPEAYPVTAYAATLNSSITNYNETVTEIGFCWSKTKTLPKLEDCEGSGVATFDFDNLFSYKLEGLTPNTRYYVSAYAKVTVDGETSVIYASSSFETNPLRAPVIDPIDLEENLGTSIRVSAEVDDIGDAPVTDQGFCYTTNPNTDISAWTRIQGTVTNTWNDGAFEFKATITGTTPGTTYYIRAYATNEWGIGYTSVKSVVTATTPGKGDNESPDNF